MILGIFLVSITVMNLILYFDEKHNARLQKARVKPADQGTQDLLSLANALGRHGAGAPPTMGEKPVQASEDHRQQRR